MWKRLLIGFCTLMTGAIQADLCCDYPINGEAAVAYDYFRSLPEGTWEGNQGAYVSANFWAPLPLNDNGVGLQAGVSYGLYDWAGRGSALNGHSGTLQQQLFFTAAVYRLTPCENGLNLAAAFDLNYNRRMGVFGLNATFSQARAQIGYLVDGTDEYGIWGTIDTNTAHEKTQEVSVKFRAISQANLFWRHYFCMGAESMVWIGMPYKKSLMFSGRAGSFLAGFSLRTPVTEVLSLACHGSYMGPRSHGTSRKFQNYAANICVGLVYAFGTGCADETPYLPLADNSSFIADTSLNY